MKLRQKPIDKKLTSNLKHLLVLFLIVGTIVSITQGQSKRKKAISKVNSTVSCKIATTVFKCPEDFTKEKNIDENIQLFKRNYEGYITYFFVAMPKAEFDDSNLRKTIAEKLSGKSAEDFRWKDINEPLVMNLETKYEKKVVNRIGYNDKLINFISRYFDFNGKTIVLGYGYETEGAGLVNFFEKGEGIGDNAIGCNAIATTLNSITKEKKGNLQYCTLSALSASR